MWAEIHKKIPSDLAGLEDMLTGNFFGLLQYGSPQLLASLLEAVSFPFNKDNRSMEFEAFLALLRSGDLKPRYHFWPYHKGNCIDLLITFPDAEYLLGIEVKYLSGISGNDPMEAEMDTQHLEKERLEEVGKSKHQLLKYARDYSEPENNRTAFFILWAPIDMAADIMTGISNTGSQMKIVDDLKTKKVFLGQMSWQKAAIQLQKTAAGKDADLLNGKIILDLIDYLKIKQLDGFVRFDDDAIPISLNETILHFHKIKKFHSFHE